MSSRRRGAPADMAAVRKSRAGFTGAVTKALDKLTLIPSDEPEEIQAVNTKEVSRLLSSLERTEAGFLTNLEDAQAFLPEGEEEEAFTSEEDLALDIFQDSISAARDRAETLLALKAVLTSLAEFKTDSTSIQDFLETNPGSNQANSLQDLKTLYRTIREVWKGTNLPPGHSLKAEVDAGRNTITALEDAISTGRDKADSHVSLSSTRSASPSEHSTCCGSKSDLPVIDVPKFYGNIMAWSTFWAYLNLPLGIGRTWITLNACIISGWQLRMRKQRSCCTLQLRLQISTWKWCRS